MECREDDLLVEQAVGIVGVDDDEMGLIAVHDLDGFGPRSVQ
jgi:hypothetical protein